MADKSIKAIDIHNGVMLDVIPNAIGMYVDTNSGKQYSVNEIQILTDEELEYIENMRKSKEKRREEVMNCTDWDAFTVEIAKIVLPIILSQKGTDFLNSAMEDAAKAIKNFVNSLQHQMIEPYEII